HRGHRAAGPASGDVGGAAALGVLDDSGQAFARFAGAKWLVHVGALSFVGPGDAPWIGAPPVGSVLAYGQAVAGRDDEGGARVLVAAVLAVVGVGKLRVGVRQVAGDGVLVAGQLGGEG